MTPLLSRTYQRPGRKLAFFLVAGAVTLFYGAIAALLVHIAITLL